MPDRPNILFLFSDQQRWDTLNCYGQKLPVSPNLDRIAEEGVRFESAFTCQPVCGPARSCLQTGQYATETGCYTNDIALRTDARTIAHVMSEAGYEVGYVGKWHLASTHAGSSPETNFRTKPVPVELRGGWKDYWVASDVLEFTSHGHDGHMFDGDGRKRVFREGRYRVDAVTDFALDFLQKRRGDRPFFLFVSYIEPHHQNDRKHYEGPKGSKERFRDFDAPGDLEGQEGDWKEELPDYLGCCASLDENVGRYREELEKQGILDGTLVLYTSDHGSHFRTRNGEYKRACHDGCLRIPMIARGPGFRGGKVIADLASLIDVPPTFLAAGGVASSMKGRPLQGLADGTAEDWPKEIFAQISESHVGRCIRTRKWKYSVRAPGLKGWKKPASERYVEDFLYDLAKDPHERNSLVKDPALREVRAELARTLLRRMVEAGEKEPVIEPAE